VKKEITERTWENCHWLHIYPQTGNYHQFFTLTGANRLPFCQYIPLGMSFVYLSAN